MTEASLSCSGTSWGGRAGCAWLLVACCWPTPGWSQRVVRLAEQRLLGVVIDAASRQPIPFALVGLGDQRQFASAAGRFSFGGLRLGRLEITAAQIGFAPAAVSVQLVESADAPAELSIALTRMALVLPELRVVASASCPQGTPGSLISDDPVITAVLENARRLLALEQAYPFESVFLFRSERFNERDSVVASRTGTNTVSTQGMRGYRPRKVIERGGRNINYFTTSDLARPAFLQAHCLWHLGADTVEGRPALSIGFGPTATTTGPDWSGRLAIDAESARLLRSDAALVNLDTTRTKLRSVSCTVVYGEIVPSVLHEAGAQCALDEAREGAARTLETLQVASIRFLKRKPGDP